MATSLLSISSSTPTSHLRQLSSHFKGNVNSLRPNPSPFPSITLCHRTPKLRQPLLVLNSAASAVQESSGSVQNARFRLDNLGPAEGMRPVRGAGQLWVWNEGPEVEVVIS